MFSLVWLPFCPDSWEPPDFPWPTEPSFRVPGWDLREPPDFPWLTESSSLLAPFCPDPWGSPDFPRPTEPSFNVPDWDLRETPDFPWLTPSSSFLEFLMDRDSSESAWPNFKIIKIIQSDKLCIVKQISTYLEYWLGCQPWLGLESNQFAPSSFLFRELSISDRHLCTKCWSWHQEL